MKEKGMERGNNPKINLKGGRGIGRSKYREEGAEGG